MDGIYPVLFGQAEAGTVQVQRQGLYYRFLCRCRLTGDVVCRLVVRCGDRNQSLGIVVPEGDGFFLDTRLPVKKLGQGGAEFYLVPRHERDMGTFVPLCPEEPFAYIQRLKDAYFIRRYGQPGVMLKE